MKVLTHLLVQIIPESLWLIVPFVVVILILWIGHHKLTTRSTRLQAIPPKKTRLEKIIQIFSQRERLIKKWTQRMLMRINVELEEIRMIDYYFVRRPVTVLIAILKELYRIFRIFFPYFWCSTTWLIIAIVAGRHATLQPNTTPFQWWMTMITFIATITTLLKWFGSWSKEHMLRMKTPIHRK